MRAFKPSSIILKKTSWCGYCWYSRSQSFALLEVIILRWSSEHMSKSFLKVWTVTFAKWFTNYACSSKSVLLTVYLLLPHWLPDHFVRSLRLATACSSVFVLPNELHGLPSYLLIASTLNIYVWLCTNLILQRLLLTCLPHYRSLATPFVMAMKIPFLTSLDWNTS